METSLIIIFHSCLILYMALKKRGQFAGTIITKAARNKDWQLSGVCVEFMLETKLRSNFNPQLHTVAHSTTFIFHTSTQSSTTHIFHIHPLIHHSHPPQGSQRSHPYRPSDRNQAFCKILFSKPMTTLWHDITAFCMMLLSEQTTLHHYPLPESILTCLFPRIQLWFSYEVCRRRIYYTATWFTLRIVSPPVKCSTLLRSSSLPVTLSA